MRVAVGSPVPVDDLLAAHPTRWRNSLAEPAALERWMDEGATTSADRELWSAVSARAERALRRLEEETLREVEDGGRRR